MAVTLNVLAPLSFFFSILFTHVLEEGISVDNGRFSVWGLDWQVCMEQALCAKGKGMVHARTRGMCVASWTWCVSAWIRKATCLDATWPGSLIMDEVARSIYLVSS